MAGLEPVLAAELAALGATQIEAGTRIVNCSGDPETLYRINYESRTALRVLVAVHSFQARDERSLYNKVRQIDWAKYLQLDQTLAIDAVTNSDHFRHSQYVALKTKDAIVDQFRDRFQRRPNVDTRRPDLRLNVHIYQDQCTISLDSSGESLHKRGYRVDSVDAPLNEVLAAGMVLLSGWQADRPFLDPMCGSGTLLIEAAMYASRIPVQRYRRDFGFLTWPDFDKNLWEKVKSRALDNIQPLKVPILGYDQDFKAVKISNENLLAARLKGVEVARKKFEVLDPPPGPGLLMMNPPYDERLPIADSQAFYKMIGDRFKQAYAGYEAWVISSNAAAMKSIGLRPSRKITLYNGPLECRLMKFEMYEGSRKRPAGEEQAPDR